MPLETVIPVFGKVVSVASIQGERFYFCVNTTKDISMVPANEIEQEYLNDVH